MAVQADDLTALVIQIVKDHAPSARIAASKAAEEEARALIVSNLGNLTQENLSQILKSSDRDFWGGQLKQGCFGLNFQQDKPDNLCATKPDIL